MAPTMLSNSMILGDAIVLDDHEKRNKIIDNEPFKKTNSKLLNETLKFPKIQITRSEIVWNNVIIFLVLHLSAFYGIYLILTGEANIFSFVLCKSTFSFLEFFFHGNSRLKSYQLSLQRIFMGCSVEWASQLVHIVFGLINHTRQHGNLNQF